MKDNLKTIISSLSAINSPYLFCDFLTIGNLRWWSDCWRPLITASNIYTHTFLLHEIDATRTQFNRFEFSFPFLSLVALPRLKISVCAPIYTCQSEVWFVLFLKALALYDMQTRFSRHIFIFFLKRGIIY